MLSSISKLRPAGNNHYYKYAHCKNEEDLKKINPRFSDDYDGDGTWDYSLQDFEAPGRKSDTSSWVDDGVSIFQNNTKIKKICIDAPNSISFRGFFSRCPNLEEVYFKNVDNDKIKYIAMMFAWSPNLKTISGNFNPNPNNLRDSWAIFRGCAGLIANNNHVFPYFEWLDKAGHSREDFNQTIWLEENKGGLGNTDKWKLDDRYTFKNIGCLDIRDSSWSNGSAMYMTKLPDNLSLKNVVNLSIVGCLEDEFRTVDTMEKCQKLDFNGNSYLRHLYKDSVSFSLPSAKNVQFGLYGGTATMYSCALSGDSVIKLSNALPTWTDGKDKNTISIMMHNDNFYNPEVNLAIKRLDKDFITPIEQKGGTLPEEILEDKGWRVKGFLCCNTWGPISLFDEYLQEPILDEIDYSIELPDGYQRCKWLKSTGTKKQYINTELRADNETGLMMICKSCSGDTTNGSFGNTYSGTGSIFCPYVSQGSWWNGRWNNAGLSGMTQGSYAGRTNVGKLNWLNDRNWSCTVGMEYSQSGTISEMTTFSTKPIWMFGVDYNANTYYTGCIYRAKISQGTEIIRDFIPCLNLDGKPCMYDIINGVEYHNQGTGEDFEYELAPVIENPEDDGTNETGDAQNVTILETGYLTGVAGNPNSPRKGSERIDSGITLQEGYSVEITPTNLFLYEEKDGKTSAPQAMLQPFMGASYLNSGNEIYIVGQYTDATKPVKIKFLSDTFNVTGDGYLSMGEPDDASALTAVSDTNEATGICVAPISLITASTSYEVELNWWKIYNENDILISDMVPAQHNDGRRGMYCKVRDLFIPISYV